jgi:biopolymer transport protein ExbD
MPKLKMARKSTHIDMTAMCDVAFLLLTFFMLAAKAKPQEAVQVTTPNSISDLTLEDTSIMMITVDAKDRVFFSIDKKKMASGDGEEARYSTIEALNKFKGMGLTEKEMQNFSNGGSFGVPFDQMKNYLSNPAGQSAMNQTTPGIPVDTSVTAPNNELATWITTVRDRNPYLRVVIKGDAAASYPVIDKVMRTLEGLELREFYLVTNLEATPPGTAAYESARNAPAAPAK